MYKKINDIEKVHNYYTYELIDENGEVVFTNTVFNEANSGFYVADIGTSLTNSTILAVKYKAYDTQGNLSEKVSTIIRGVTLTRQTPKENIDFGDSAIEFSGTVEFTPDSFVGQIEGFGVGGGTVVKINATQTSPATEVRYYWSEANSGGEKQQNQTLIIRVHLFIVPVAPNIAHYYNREISTILNLDTGCFPTPAPRGLYLSALNVNNLPQKLDKRIPTVAELSTQGHSLTEIGKPIGYELTNPATSLNPNYVGYSFISTNQLNIGSARSMVLSGIGAISIDGRSTEVNYIIPVVKLTAVSIAAYLAIEQNDFYFYASVPCGCIDKRQISIDNVVLSSDITSVSWTNPADLGNITVTGVALDGSSEPVSIESLNTEGGDYYSAYIFGEDGDYWEPPSGSPVCPPYVYFGEKPYSVYTGSNISCEIQGERNGTWTTLATSSSYRTVYVPQSGDYDSYRARVSAPSMTNTNYYVNSMERQFFGGKTYDPNVLRIGNGSTDFGKAGIRITRSKMEEWANSLGASQDEATSHTIGIVVGSGENFYKAPDSTALLKYGVEVYGI